MKREAYLADPDVRAFLEWAEPLTAGVRPLVQQWHSPRWGAWSCETLFGAYQAYHWPFVCILPGDSTVRRGSSYRDTAALLDTLSEQLRRSVDESDPKRFLEAAISVVQWGQVRQNVRRLRELGDDALPRLTESARRLDPAEADLDSVAGIRPMNSGFSKIYSLLQDRLPIYDSRVACGLASLVRLFREETDRAEVPATLRFAIPPSQGRVNRDPSRDGLLFPRIRTATRYARANLMAAWVLDNLSENSPFFELGDDRLRALQSAMFMIGYTVLAQPSPG